MEAGVIERISGRRTPIRTAGAWVLLIGVLGPALAAVWLVPWFVTQDGPAHLYNAGLLLDAMLGRLGPAQAAVYEASWRPVPNWGGHALLMGLLAVFPPWVADRLMTSLTLLAVPLAALWARSQVWGRRGQRTAALGFAVMGLGLPWLLGFGAFLIGLAIGVVTLGLAWRWRGRMDGARASALGALLVSGYLGHLVALAMTAFGVAAIALLAGGTGVERRRRGTWMGAALAVLGPLFLLYRSMAGDTGEFAPIWEHLTSWVAPSAWMRQVGWADPITIGRRTLPPIFEVGPSIGWAVVAPVVWFGVGLGVLAVSCLRSYAGAYPTGVVPGGRAWLWMAAFGLLGALLGPDSFGEAHGHYLPQRLALFGLTTGLIGLDLEGRRGTWAGGAWVVALALQSATVWGYALASSERVGAVMAAGPSLGRDQRIGALMTGIGGRYRSNPLLHADCALGVGTGHVVWGNYETRYYYFPIHIRAGLDAPPAAEFEEVAIRDAAGEAGERAERWERLLRGHAGSMDVLVCHGREPALDEVTARWFGREPSFESGALRVFRASRIAGAQGHELR